MRNEDSIKLLVIHVNNNLNFDYHVNQLCKKASTKLHDLARIAKYMDINKRRMVMKTYIFTVFLLPLPSNMDVPWQKDGT